MRSDPDIIMIGEIRDQESASLAVKASVTGHMVMSTLHSSNVLLTLERLKGFGIEPYQIAENTNIIVSQTLRQRLCPCCRVPENGLYIRNNQGCDDCNFGLKGKVMLAEYCVAPNPQDIVDENKENITKSLKQTMLGEFELAVKRGDIDYRLFESEQRPKL
jgi:type II secretory ATPase GspE/PulE/Tfp pilus assembly ATPase PilB-like protein